MDHGGVAQEGTAEDLYYRPASQFVAGFIGRVNLVAGRLVQTAERRCGVAALGTVIAVTHVPEGAAPGDAVQLILRPEAIAIARDDKSGPLRATVVSCTFLGEKVEYLLRCAGETLQSVRYNTGPAEIVPEGAAVCLRVADDSLNVLPGKRV
jgi:ABC-type Fe3+/spermidine/putrescine transport system ATPase subunit